MRRASAFLRQFLQRLGKPGPDRPTVFRCRTQKHQRADLVAVVAGDHGVLDERVAGGDQLHADRARVHPGAGDELEILGDAAVEDEAFLGRRRVGELHRVADAVVAFLVERSLGQVVAAEVAGRDVGALDAHLQLAAGGHELQLAAGRRAGRSRRRARSGSARTTATARSRSSPRPRSSTSAPPFSATRELLQALPEVLRQRRAGVEHHVQVAEEDLRAARRPAPASASAGRSRAAR